MQFEPVWSTERAVAREVWDGRQIAARRVANFFHPIWIVRGVLPDFGPVAGEAIGMGIPR